MLIKPPHRVARERLTKWADTISATGALPVVMIAVRQHGAGEEMLVCTEQGMPAQEVLRALHLAIGVVSKTSASIV